MIRWRTAGPSAPRQQADGTPTGSVRRAALAVAGASLLLVAMAVPTAAAGPGAAQAAQNSSSAHPGNMFQRRNLVSDVPGMAAVTDPNLVNAWGMSAGPTTPVWVSDNGSDVTTLYQGATHHDALSTIPLVVSIPSGAPTGQVYNPSSSWVVTSGADSGPALFIFAGESGTISGWNSTVPTPAPSTNAQVGVTVANAVYKGLAISTGAGGNWLYAANFHTGKIDVFNGSWSQVHWPGAFHDAMIPAGYAPFNIQNLGGRLYVTYAKQDGAKHDDVKGMGHGFLDVYNLKGHLIRRLAKRGTLDSPWGLAIAPSGFGRFVGDLLVGNFGDGRISAFDPMTGHLDGLLRNRHGKFITIDGLWGLMFGNGTAGSPHTLLFTAGPGGESHGLMGTIEAAP